MNLRVKTRSETLSRRNRAIISRYWYWYHFKMRRDAMEILEEKEFFLSEQRIQMILLEYNDNLNTILKRSKKEILRKFRRDYPSWDWSAEKQDFLK